MYIYFSVNTIETSMNSIIPPPGIGKQYGSCLTLKGKQSRRSKKTLN